MLIRIVTVLLAISCPMPARSWSAHGHEAIGAIAQRLLSPDVRRAVSAILGEGVTLDQIATCADDIRGQRGFYCASLWFEAEPQSQPWHFIDIPITDSPQNLRDIESYCPGGACVVDQIRAAAEQLRSPSNKATDKQVALMFLVHFVGDEHQPLHCVERLYNGANDRGGNTEPVIWDGVTADGSQLNLHAVWDHVIAPTDSLEPGALTQELLDTLPPDASSWTSGDYVSQAAFESFTIAKNSIYPSYDQNGGRLGGAYQTEMQPIAMRRLQMAGVRLAALVESALVPIAFECVGLESH